ncbi:MAG: TonB-dependent receptor [Acidobacteria bacterium]|nr:TonB-dependent receptor [Acidobacteriota bacterium]
MLFAALSLAFENVASAQTAQLTGRVVDPSGAAIRGATVTVTNAGTSVSKRAVSNQEGIYTIPFLQPGQYRITVQMAGFKPLRHEGLTLSVDQMARLDLELELGEVVEEVTVESYDALLERETSSVGQVIENKTIVTLPLNGRNYSQLALLMPGVAPDQVASVSVFGVADGLNVNGNRVLQNTFLIDGMDNNNHLLAIRTGSTQALRPSIDAIQEFKVESANYSAEYGRAAGGVISVVIKSGTNSFHGSAFEFLRNDKLDANDFFSNRGGLKRPPLRFNQFGGTLGGPILSNRLFFFASYQGTRDHRSDTVSATVPTPEMVRGNFGSVNIYDPLNVVGGVRQQFPNNIIPGNRMDPVGRRLAGLYPAPNQPGTVANFVSNVGTRDSADQIDLRLDHHVKNSDNLFVRYSKLGRGAAEASLFGLPGNGGPGRPGLKNFDAYSVVGGETHIFSASLANEFRAGYTGNQSDERNLANESFYEEFGIKGIPPFEGKTGLPNFSLSNFSGLGDSINLPDKRHAQVLQINDNLSWIRGNHTSKFGAELRLRKNFGRRTAFARGVFMFDGRFTTRIAGDRVTTAVGSSLADLLLGQTSSATLGTLQTGDFRDRYYGFYGNDTWKLTPGLTLNLGLRYDLQTPVWEVNNRMSMFDLDRTSPTFGTLVAATGGRIRARTFSNLDTNNFGPRIGFACLVEPKTVIRGAFGIFYGGRGFENVPSTGAGNPPYTITIPINSPSTAPYSSLVLADGFPAGMLDPGNAQRPALYAQPPDYPFVEVYQWNLGVQRALIADMLLSLTYVGSGTAHLNGFTDPNQPPPGPDVNLRRPFPTFASISYQSAFAHATYHSLQMKLERRFTKGLSLLSSYTFSHAIDNSLAIEDQGNNAGGSWFSQDPKNTNAEKASSSFDIQQRFVTSIIYELPIGGRGRVLGDSRLGRVLLGGWQLGGIFVVQGGTPMTPVLTNPPSGLPNPAGGPDVFRPDRLRDGSLPDSARSIDRWFDLGAFVPSARYTFGNSGRNVIRAPGYINMDLLIARNFTISETTRLELRGEFFNLTNSVHLGRPNIVINSRQAGRIQSTSAPNRQIQIGLRLVF